MFRYSKSAWPPAELYFVLAQWFNSPRPRFHHAGTAVGTKVQHAKLASDLATCPILNPNPLTQASMSLVWRTYHRGRGKRI